jgi:hypothetical protein
MTSTPTVTATSGSAGLVAFTAFIQNGSSEFSFMAPSGLAANQVVYFTNDSYDNTTGGLVAFATPDPSGASGQGVTEGIISYTAPAAGLGAMVPVVISKTTNDANMLQGGTLANVAGNTGNTFLVLNHNGEGHKILAYTVSAGVTQYAAALIFGPDSWKTSGTVTNYWDSYMPPGLNANYTTDLSGAWASGSLSSFVTQGNQNALLNTCQTTLAGIVSPTNWVADGNVPTGTLFLDNAGSPMTPCASGTSAGWTGTIPPSEFPTATFTATNSFTVTNSPTITNTLTPTNTNIVGTNTFTGTPTLTGTPTNSPTVTSSPTVTATIPTSGSAGLVAFTAFIQNGSSEFSFVAPSGLAANQVVYFTNDSYDNTAGGLVAFATPDPSGATGQGVTQGIISYTAPAAGLGAMVPVVISKTTNDANKLQGGTLVNVAGNLGDTFLVLNHNGEGEKILAFTIPSAGVTQYAAGLIFGPDTWKTSGTVTNYWDSYMPPGLNSNYATDLSGIWNTDGLSGFVTQGNQNALLNTCETTLAGIVSPTNWVGDGNVPTGTLFLDNAGSPMTPCASGISAGWTGTLPPSEFSTATFTPTVTFTATQTVTPTVTNTNPPGTSTFTPTVTSSPTSTTTPSGPTATFTASPTSTFTRTITAIPVSTATIAPTSTSTPAPTATPSLGQVVFAPMPLRTGETLYLFPDKPIISNDWKIFNLMGEMVTEISANSWSTQGVAPGVYIVEMTLTYTDGSMVTTTKKILIRP